MLKESLKTLSHSPGVYVMHNLAGEVIYVGKAKNLYKRVNSYFAREPEDPKTQALVREIDHFTVTVTRSEDEALILENHLIKTHKPKYNIIFKDDKSYPYLYLSTQHPFPQLTVYRGDRKKEGLSFGPYPSATSTRDMLKLLQKVFRLRNCEDSFFKSRSRPCLQYQLQRCSAPCVKKISAENYALDVSQVKLFLEGKSHRVMEDLAVLMEKASADLDFERAAKLRDQIQALQKLQSSQAVFSGTSVNVDVIALSDISGFFALAILMVRDGRVLGVRLFFPERLGANRSEEILTAFASQFYGGGSGRENLPSEIYFADKLSKECLAELQSWMPKGVTIKNRSGGLSGVKLKWMEMAKINADEALKSKFSTQFLRHERLEAFKQQFGLDTFRQAVCFDISHSLGESTVASAVVFEEDGPHKKLYRRFNIQSAGGDDYAALQQAVHRYFSRLTKEGQSFPSMLLIDGGIGQLNAVIAVLSDFPSAKDMRVLSISKAEFRTSGFEQIWEAGKKLPTVLDPADLSLYFLQEMRDEAHRFALAAHRKQRLKRRVTSVLEHIPGVGTKRRQALLNYFGSLNAVKTATREELLKVSGISQSVAARIYEWARG